MSQEILLYTANRYVQRLRVLIWQKAWWMSSRNIDMWFRHGNSLARSHTEWGSQGLQLCRKRLFFSAYHIADIAGRCSLNQYPINQAVRFVMFQQKLQKIGAFPLSLDGLKFNRSQSSPRKICRYTWEADLEAYVVRHGGRHVQCWLSVRDDQILVIFWSKPGSIPFLKTNQRCGGRLFQFFFENLIFWF